MSFKSQKSFNEEISEIWERSYSVRSLSEESLSCEDEAEGLCRELLTAMNPAVLSKLRRKFTKNHIRSLKDATRRVEQVMRQAAAEEGIEFKETGSKRKDELWIDQPGFVAAIDKIFGNHKFSPHANALFRALDPLQTRQVSWSALLDRLVQVGARKTGSRVDSWKPICEDQDIRQLTHCKRETIVKIVNIESDRSFCFAAVTRGGRVGLYREGLLLHHYELWYHRNKVTTRVKNCWVTDAIYMSDGQCLLIAASDRSLTVYDASILTHTPVYCITGLPNIPTCFAYEPSQSMSGTSELMFGDERGIVTRMRFQQPRLALFHNSYTDRINCYFWRELWSPPHSGLVTISSCALHQRSVRRVQYCGRALASSSRGDLGLILRHREGKIRDYVFRVPRGVWCFDAVPSLHVVATGSCAGAVRLWEPTQPAPYACLRASAPRAVIDLLALPDLRLLVGCLDNCTVDIWDLYEECLLQTIKIKYPFLGVLGKKPEFGSYCIYPGAPRKKSDGSEECSVSQTAASSRRPSVQRARSGALLLQPEQPPDEQPVTDEKSEALLNCSELVVACCDYTLVLPVRERSGEVPPPPGDSRDARRPAGWDLSELVGLGPSPPPSAEQPAPPAREEFLTVESALRPEPDADAADLDTLLENAGLQGILEKDFVLMMGLKNDLNHKLAELKANMNQMWVPVSRGAPYLALRLHEPSEPPPVDDMMDRYRRVMSIFPAGSSVAGSQRPSSRPSPRPSPRSSPRASRRSSSRTVSDQR